MAEVLKEWLTDRLQSPIKWEAEEFGDMMKNGYVIARVLLSYKVINDEKHFLIKSSKSIEDVKSNWKYLTEWLRQLEINLNDTELNFIMDGKGSTLLRLFYQLFLTLDKRDRTNFIQRERKMVSTLVDKLDKRFKVDKVEEEQEAIRDDLSRPLLNEKYYIEWQRKKSEQVKDTYDYIRHKYSKILAKVEESKAPLHCEAITSHPHRNKDRKEMDKFAMRYPCKFENYTYDQLLELEEKALENKQTSIDTNWVKSYMANLNTKMNKISDSKEFQKQLTNVLSGSLWDLSVAEEETKLDIELAKKVMKLSQFEKQMCTKIMETKQQARNLVKNRIRGEAEFADQREQQFHQFLDNVKGQINLEVDEIDFEKRRQNMLHKKLYAEKMEKKRQYHYEICYETMLSIVDYVTKYAYYKLLIGDDIPEHFIHEWKILYYKQQPIFDVLDSMEILLKETGIEEKAMQEEEIKRDELNRQEALYDNEFKEYHNYSGPWTLDLLIPNYDPESEERKYEYLGTRVMGHAVYTLLEMKYPYPPPRHPAQLPQFVSKALLRDLPDRSITIPMQALLNLRQIHVVRIETAINFCLRRFKTEMVGCNYVDLSYDKFSAVAQADTDRELIKLLKVEDETTNKTNDLNVATMLGVFPPNSKQTQTPKTLPEEEIILSTAADLGRYAYESLNFGDSLTDQLVAATIVEYLKYQDDIKGFVIINYPNTYRQAQILEETFSGRAPPEEADLDDSDDIYLEERILKHRKEEKDPYKEVRESKIVNDPHKRKIEKPFQSYFTCYIRLKESEDILQELVIWDLTEDNSEFLDRFYAALGINYSMYYEVIEKDFLAQICKYIIGDFLMPLKSHDRLFGYNVLSLLDFPSSEDKRTKSKIVKPEFNNGKSREKLRRGSKMSKQSMNNDLAVIKASNSIEENYNDIIPVLKEKKVEDNDSISFSTEHVKIVAGEEEWNYAVLPIAEIIGVALATCWEEIEKGYICDIKRLFFSKRLQINTLVPYARFIKDKMEQIITLPSQKQDLVCKFQKDYNDFENDWRDVHLTKNEWHCRVKELQYRLYHICDERKLYAEQQRQGLICDNWVIEELTTLVNTYFSCMQTELNRSVLMFQTLHDFYFAMIKRIPVTDRLSSKDLTKILREADDTSSSKKGGEDKVYRQLKLAFQDMQLRNIEMDHGNNPFNVIIENNVKFALKVIKDTNDSYRSLISKEYLELAKMVPMVKKKDENNSDESNNAEEIFIKNALKCIEEWTMGINGEMFRASLRILALQYKCYRDIKLFTDHLSKTFINVQEDINNYYLNEIKSVDRLCKYIHMAIEGGRRISESLILERDTFVIDPNLLQFDPLDTTNGSGVITEIVGESDFKISQLARLRSQFKLVAPTGISLQQAFIYLLQDFIFYGKESYEGPLVPEDWCRIDPEQIPKFVLMLFGDTVYIDWRDFLIYCLNISFPTVEELLEIRKTFRCLDTRSTELINRNEFVNKKFWFDQQFDLDDKHARLRHNLIKHFLFELYEVQDNMMNYSAFLLAFCKSADPIEGFASALSMAVGKKICFNLSECQEIICKLIQEKQNKDECLACALKCTHRFLSMVITNVVNSCEGTTIVELQYTEPTSEEKKGKKSAKGAKGKIESSQSARIPKSQKSLINQKSNIAQSATDVKTTFICRPCDEVVEVVEERLPEKKEVQEESRIQPRPDPNLAYAVSQNAIWNVLCICLPWHFRSVPGEKITPYVDQVKELIHRLEVDTDNGDIYVSKFVSDPIICKLLHKVKKFTIIKLAEEIRKVYI